MEDIVFLNNSILILGLALAMALLLFGIRKKALPVTVLALAVFVSTLTYGTFLKASLYEGGAVCVLFLIVSLLAAKE